MVAVQQVRGGKACTPKGEKGINMIVQKMYMTDAEYKKAIEEIVASGRGLEAIKEISQREIFYRDLSDDIAREDKARLTAINKIVNSSQTASQKLDGIKPLSERE